MIQLTKDFKKRIMENGSIDIDDVNQILKNKEIAEFLEGRESIMTYEKEAEEAKQIIKQLEYRKKHPQAFNYAQFESWITDILAGGNGFPRFTKDEIQKILEEK